MRVNQKLQYAEKRYSRRWIQMTLLQKAVEAEKPGFSLWCSVVLLTEAGLFAAESQSNRDEFVPISVYLCPSATNSLSVKGKGP
jgi:hypothetical protein